MMRRGRRLFLMLAGIYLSGMTLMNSQVLVESIAAIVGNEVVYLSDVEEMVNEIRLRGDRTPTDQLRCMVLQELLVSKLFLDQARIDSISVTDEMVEGEVNAQINDVIRQAGSEQVLMEYFKKSMI